MQTCRPGLPIVAAASMKIGEVMYGNKEAESATQGGESPSQNADDGKVVEGEFYG